ncbi:MAG: ribose 5-phosphate isomerase B [Firmicutes bacterium]|nr:ribose 5-phosphate isomerase B [Bacillota bacterium]
MNKKITVALGNDHAAFSLKKTVIEFLERKGIEYKDFGTFEDKADYPDFAEKVSAAVARGEFDYGVLLCGTGVGISIAANKVKGIRAAVCADSFTARATRQHNDANILAMGERVVGSGVAVDILDAFFSTAFEGGRHQARVDKISAMEQKYFK